MEPLVFEVTEELSGCTVNHILHCVMRMSRSHISRLKRRGSAILKNGNPVYVTERVDFGDIVSAEICDSSDSARLEPMSYPLNIVYEDEWLLILDKPAGMTVHPERLGVGGSVENALSAYLKEDEFVHTVSRLDRGTSGLMTVAKCGYMHELLRGMLHTEAFHREYRAIAVGIPHPNRGSIELPLGHPEDSSYKMAVTENGVYSLTDYETLSTFRCAGSDRICSLLRLVPQTGRMHQLRVHMASVGNPLLGDWLYGEECDEISRPALHSYRICLKHPLTDKYIKAEAPLPLDMNLLINYAHVKGW